MVRLILAECAGVTDMRSDIDRRKASICFIILLLIDVLDLVCDWLFFTDVYLIEKGLVFGPHDPKLVWAVLIFTIVGTLDFPLQIYVTVMESLVKEPRPKDEKRLNKYNFAILIAEDLPQAILLLMVSLCREDPSSIWSLTKAAFILLTSVIKLVPNFKACCKKFSSLKTIILIGAVLEFIIGLIVFCVTQIELTDQGGLHFNKPTTIVDERFNDNVYLADVSLFIHDPNIFTNDATMKSSELPWIRLDYVRHIQKSEHCSMRLEYEKSVRHTDITKLKILEKREQAWKAIGCYTISTRSGKVELVSPSSLSCFHTTSKTSNLTLTFKYVKPENFFKKHIMGDIVFNANYQKPGKKHLVNFNSSTFSPTTSLSDGDKIYKKDNLNGIGIKTPILLHYFKHQSVTKSKDHENNNVLITGKTTGRLYRNTKDELKDMKDVWKTGWLRCPTTGNLGPWFDEDVKVVT